MTIQIQNKTLTDKDIGRNVTYVPTHARSNKTDVTSGIDHEDCEYGQISSFNEHAVFVNFGRYTAGCYPTDLVWG